MWCLAAVRAASAACPDVNHGVGQAGELCHTLIRFV